MGSYVFRVSGQTSASVLLVHYVGQISVGSVSQSSSFGCLSQPVLSLVTTDLCSWFSQYCNPY